MGRSLKIGKAFGIGLYVHWTFLLLPALILFANVDNGIEAMLFGLTFILSVFGCVVLHELGHALMAKSYGIGTRDITLFPIGGVARLEGMGSNPWQEIAIAVAGPAVNVVIAAGLWLGMSLGGHAPWTGAWNSLTLSGPPAVAFLREMLHVNILLVLFNVIPAFPMDGGRVLRAMLTLGFGRLKATEIALRVATFVALVFIVGGLFGWRIGGPVDFQMTPMLSLIGFFILFAGQQELAVLRYQDARQRGLVGGPTFGSPHQVVEPADVPWAAPAEPNFSGFTWDPRAGVWIEWRNGHPVGACSAGPTVRPW
jgi:Zn-dependent protease